MIKWINRCCPNGIFNGPLARTLSWCDSHLSLNGYWNRFVRSRLGIPYDKKNPPWVSEVYLCASFLLGSVFVALAPAIPKCVAMGIAVVALYRPIEIMVYAINWIFISKGMIHSHKRSLAGFLVNIAEVVIFFAASYLGFGLVQGDSPIATALYSSLRTTVTIGPTSTAEPPGCPFGGFLIILQVAISYFLSIVVIAGVVGALRNRDVVRRDEDAQQEHEPDV